MSGSSKRSIFSGATELATLDDSGINLARQELALVSQPSVPPRPKHAKIGSSVGIQSEAAKLCWPWPNRPREFFLESMFIDQATHNGTRPNSPVGDEPATTPSGPLRYRSTPWMGPTPEDLSVTGFVRWPSVSLVKKIVGWVMSSADGIAFQSLVDAMSSVRK